MLFIWKRSPMLRLFVPLAVGVYTELYTPLPGVMCATSLLMIAVTWFVVRFRKMHKPHGKRHFMGILFSMGVFFTGIGLTQLADERTNPQHYTRLVQEGDFLQVRLCDAPAEKEKSVKLIAEVKGILRGDSLLSATGKLLMYVQKDSSAMRLHVDEEVLVHAFPNDLQKRLNPFEFDYASYLCRHQVHRQVYAAAGQWKRSERAATRTFLGVFIRAREYFLGVLRSYGVSGREYAVLAALVLGKTSDIDDELMRSYAGAGAVHVLAVSGLHVALVYVLLAPLLKFVFPKNKRRWFKTLIPVVLLWSYAGITGFSPSVLRAALMFSCFIVAENFQKENNIYNTMSASALILVCLNPFILAEVGFQLSYLAVLGIVVLQKKITALFYPPGKILQWTWKLTAVSVAAQLSTLPMTLYFFHQFPTWFVVTNLLVIPLSTVILYVALAFFALCWWAPVAGFLAGLSAFLTRLMNDTMLFMETWPCSVISHIHLSMVEALLVVVLVILGCRWFLWRHTKSLLPALGVVATLCGIQWVEKVNTLRQSEICFHSLKDHTCITWLEGDKLWMVSDSAMAADTFPQKFHLLSYWDAKGVKDPHYLLTDHTTEESHPHFRYPFLKLGSQLFCLIDEEVLKRDELPLCDGYIFGTSMKSGFLKEEQLAFFSGKVVFLFNGFSAKKRAFLKEALPADAMVYDLAEGAVVSNENTWVHFSEKYP